MNNLKTSVWGRQIFVFFLMVGDRELSEYIGNFEAFCD